MNLLSYNTEKQYPKHQSSPRSRTFPKESFPTHRNKGESNFSETGIIEYSFSSQSHCSQSLPNFTRYFSFGAPVSRLNLLSVGEVDYPDLRRNSRPSIETLTWSSLNQPRNVVCAFYVPPFPRLSAVERSTLPMPNSTGQRTTSDFLLRRKLCGR